MICGFVSVKCLPDSLIYQHFGFLPSSILHNTMGNYFYFSYNLFLYLLTVQIKHSGNTGPTKFELKIHHPTDPRLDFFVQHCPTPWESSEPELSFAQNFVSRISEELSTKLS